MPIYTLTGHLRRRSIRIIPSEVNQLVLYEKGGLSNSSHTIKVVCSGTQKNPSSSNYYITTDAFAYIVDGGPTPTLSPTPTPGPTTTPTPVPVKIDDDHAAVAYGGTWTDDNNFAPDYLSTRHYTNSADAYSQFSFTGTRIQWLGEKDVNRGYANIYIDGAFETTVDTYNSSEVNQLVLYEKGGLSNGSHTIKIVCSGTQKNPSSSNYYLTIDAYVYFNEGGPTPTPTPAGNAVSFLGSDTTTKGSWKTVFGADGYSIINSGESLPVYATVTYTGGTNYTWSSSTTDTRALQKPDPASDRIAACRYTGTNETIDMIISGGTAKNVSIYLLGWDLDRTEKIEALDGETGAVLNTQDNITAFKDGKWMKYTVKGHIKFKITLLSGANAVFSGLFFN